MGLQPLYLEKKTMGLYLLEGTGNYISCALTFTNVMVTPEMWAGAIYGRKDNKTPERPYLKTQKEQF